MSSDKIVETEVLVVGGGDGGCVAAIRARELGVDVTLVDKAYAGKSGASAFAGGYLVVFNPEWGLDADAWMDYTVQMGEYINNREWVEVLINDSYARFQNLISWGVPFYTKDTKIVRFQMGPVINDVMMHRRQHAPALRKKAVEVGVKILDNIMLTDLLKQDGRVVGAVGFHTRDGDFYSLKAKATVIAMGGGGFKVPAGPRDYRTADGEAVSYRIGAEITGKEFHHKLCWGSREFPYARVDAGVGAQVYRTFINAEDENIFTKYGSGYQGRAADRASSDILFEAHAGHGPIFFRLKAVTPEQKAGIIAHQEATGTKFCAERCGVDLSDCKIDYYEGGQLGDSGEGRGGVRVINTKCESTIPGLYAIGDAAGTYLCGSSYTSAGHGLCHAIFTGYRAGENAAEYALKAGKPIVDEKEVTRLQEIAYTPLSRKGGFSPDWMTQMIQCTMAPYYIMQVKHGERMQAALKLVEFLKRHCGPMVRADDLHDLRKAHEVRNMLLNAEMCLQASLFRTESRGSHYREDYPRRVDPDWLAWTVLRDEDGEMKLAKLPIPKEWWPDLSTPYEERYGWRFPEELEAGLKPYPWPDDRVKIVE